MPSREIPAWLYQLSSEMRKQDNRSTSYPVYCVKERTPVYLSHYLEAGVPSLEYVKTVYANANDDEQAFYDSADAAMTAALEGGYEHDEIEVGEYEMYEQFTTNAWFFTEKEAQEYIKNFHYRLDHPFVYVESAHHMDGVVKLMDWILSLTAVQHDGTSEN